MWSVDAQRVSSSKVEKYLYLTFTCFLFTYSPSFSCPS
ncbi:hypothetical protein RintRC_6620 [Richelia intracellularis]|nr:hypothetical protein RintRC_6620 [Richelia intracellularis]